MPDRMPEGICDIPARVTAVHTERYELTCEHSKCYGKLKTGVGKSSSANAPAGEALSQERGNSYIQLKQETKYSDDKSAYLRQKQQWHKEIAKWSKQKKKTGGKK